MTMLGHQESAVKVKSYDELELTFRRSLCDLEAAVEELRRHKVPAGARLSLSTSSLDTFRISARWDKSLVEPPVAREALAS